MGIGIGSFLLLVIIVAAHVLIFGTVARKAGFTRWWSVLMVLPLVNVIAIWIFAFIDWPAEK
jgi:uncharacterized protein YqhQ